MRPISSTSAIKLSGRAEAALYGFLIIRVSCIAFTYWLYTRRGGLLHDVERRKAEGPALRRACGVAAPSGGGPAPASPAPWRPPRPLPTCP
ncbi:hypothetical protein ACFQX4_15965 [Roseomonas sp. GCM10028921]